MKNQELFDRTISILVKAYVNDTLRHYNCSACAVGNLVAANCGLSYNQEFKYVQEDQRPHFENGWAAVFATSGKNQRYSPERYVYVRNAKKQIDSTGYSFEQLAKIEYAFELAYFEDDTDEERFRGLMNVVDALMHIHEANNEEIQQAKSLFTKELAI